MANSGKVKGAPPSKWAGANDTPTRQRYWSEGRLRERKIRKLMRFNRMTREAATALWLRTRTKRIKTRG